MITKNQAKKIIDILAQRNQSTGYFDSHDFIDLYRANFEHEYIQMLNDNDSKHDNTAFQITNSQIARFLSVNSDELKIKKINISDSMNDHGNKTSNAKWKFLSIIMPAILFLSFVFAPIFSQNCNAKEEFDIPPYKCKTMYIPDTTYIRKDIVLLQNFVNQGCSKKNPLYNHIKNLYNETNDIWITKGDIRQYTKSMINKLNEIIYSTKIDAKTFSIDDMKHYESKFNHYFNIDSVAYPFYAINISGSNTYLQSNDIGYKYPMAEIIVKEPITWYEVYKMDRKNLTKGYEWINNDEENSKWVEKTYPIETSYKVFDNYPEYAIQHYDFKFGDTKGPITIIYNLQGDLVRIHDFGDIMNEEIKLAENSAYLEDYKSNKYNVASENSLTKRYIEMILSGEMEKIEAKYMGKMFGQALIGAHKESEKTARKFIKAIDREKLHRAKKYIQQLETDHETDFYMGRCVRIDNKSFYFSLVNKDGKATCIFKIDYIQDGPFAVKKNITLIGKGN
jgi:hypothetical protein